MRELERTYAVVMAGGSGTRFWPQSRRGKPKQFLPLAAGRTLFRTAVERLFPIIPPERVIVITGRGHLPIVRSEVPEIPGANLVGEPEGRDTAPCLCVGALVVRRRDADAFMLALPADHVIDPAEGLHRTVRAALAHVAAERGVLCTIGIPPDYPATGFGYIHRGPEVARHEGLPLHEVRAFREKPDRATAARYVATGQYAWNAGIFLWRVADLEEELRLTAPDLARDLDALGRLADTEGLARAMDEVFPRMRKISIDYAVMERARRVATVPAAFRWDDVGSWRALERIAPTDDAGNVSGGEHIALDTRDSIVITDRGVVATVDVEGLMVVRSGDAVLVCPKASAERVKEVVEALRARGMEAYL